MNQTRICLTSMLALAALAACGGDPATAPNKPGVRAAPGPPAHDELPDGVYEEYTVDIPGFGPMVFCRIGGSPLIAVGHCPAPVLVSISVPDGDTLRPTNETTRFPVVSNHDVVVKVVNVQGAGLAGRSVSLAVSGENTSGSHPHQRALSLLASRPRGKLTPDGTLTTNADGEARFRYEAPQFGGIETLTASVLGATAVSKSLVISEPGLVRVATEGVHYYVNPTDNHHPGDNFAFRGVIDTLVRIFDLWFESRALTPRQYPVSEYAGHGRVFKIDALALPYGGRFDVDGNWTGSHLEHRSGLEIDFNNDAVELAGGTGAENRMTRLCLEVAFGGTGVTCDVEHPENPRRRHFHVRFKRPATGAFRAMHIIRRGTSAALLAMAAATASGQAVGSKRFDAATNSYFVTVLSPAGVREVQVVPANRARASVRAAVSGAGDGWRYEYRLTVSMQSTQSLDQVEVPCAPSVSARELKGTAFTRIAGVEPVIARAVRYPDRDVCIGAVGLAAGDSMTMQLTASAAPGFAALHLIGAAQAPAWPEGFGAFIENDRAKAVVDSINGITGGWYEVVVPAPVRPLASLATPALSVRALQDDLAAACGPLALIAPAGICNSLRAKADAARQSVERGNANAANGQVGALLRELDAQRGEHVQEPAYIVLHTLALLLQSQLAR